MNTKLILGILFILLIPNIELGQVYGSNAEILSKNIINEKLELQFPNDHNAHKNFRTEWWYITANLTNNEGDYFGIQWTLFRNKTDSKKISSTIKSTNNPWASNQFWMAHAVVTSEKDHYYHEKFSRGGTGQAGVKNTPFLAWIDDWEFSSNNNWSSASIKAEGEKFSYELNLESNGPLILHGQNGISIKTKENHYSAYYSQPFFKADGRLTINNKTFYVKGNAWADREWSNAILGSSQEGWDWVSLHLDDQTKLMIFKVRDNKNGDFYSGTYISNKKVKHNLFNGDIEMIPLIYNKKEDSINIKTWEVPTEWRIIVKKHQIDINLKALNKNAFINTIVPYWEGPISFKGSHSGLGYLEMTGY